ncbi:MAG: 1,6-anhydro-N-acetylmuramyl-L-alanine amidase AmpD [Pseudomonadota bacterium]
MIRNNLTALANPSWKITQDGWCQRASRQVSPNYNARPDGADISLLVIHNISLPAGQFGGDAIAELFQNCLDCSAHESFASLREVKVSSHFLIRRDGTVLQFVSTLDRAWHAGVSSFDGRSACNDFSIGIELEGTDDLPFETAQYDSLTLLTQALLARFAITHIVGHDEIAPGRKTDPGPCFDWALYERRMLGL